jgi:serine/threonine protein kinase
MIEESALRESLQIATRWCGQKGDGWSVENTLGKGGTAPVFEIASPDGPRALKIYDEKFSSGELGEIELKRVEQQLVLKDHSCPYLVSVFEGGRFESRLFLLMSRAAGTELEKRLREIPRTKIRRILEQVARAAIFLNEHGLCHRDIKAANIFISDDFEQCTLLDISVIRNISDPVGLGTDAGGNLPVLATARYSPPEYLFRLMEPGPQLWHALTVYQLGALLHDLIMREPLFQAEYLRSAENRYRFAWIIATKDPVLAADDVDRDLILTARRALDKDWERRSYLRLEDFIDDPTVRRTSALQMLGFGWTKSQSDARERTVVASQRAQQLAVDLKGRFLQYLQDSQIRATHTVRPGQHDQSKVIHFQWIPAGSTAPEVPSQIQLDISLDIQFEQHEFQISPRLEVQIVVGGQTVIEDLSLPSLKDEAGIEPVLLTTVQSAFEALAIQVLNSNRRKE